MKRILIYLFISFLAMPVCVADPFGDELPSDTYYRENIQNKSNNPLVLKGDDDDNPGGPGSGTGGGGHVGQPVGDAVLPVMTALGLYALVLTVRKRRRSEA